MFTSNRPNIDTAATSEQAIRNRGVVYTQDGQAAESTLNQRRC